MKRYRTVLLDIDGTLADSNDLHAQAWKEALFDRGFYVPFQKIRSLIGMGGDKLLPTLTGLDIASPEARTLTAYRAGVFLSRYLPKVESWPHVRTLLERMKEEDLKVVIATSANKEEREALLAKIGVMDLVDIIVGAGPGVASKPDPDIIARALETSGTASDEAIMIGDTPYDIEAAQRAGVDAIAFRCGGAPEASLAGAISIYDDPMDLLENFATSPIGAYRR